MARRREVEVQQPVSDEAGTPNGELIIHRRRDHVEALIPRANAGPESYPTNLPTTTRGLACRVNCEGSPDLDMPESGSIDLEVWAYLVHPQQCLNPESGEVYYVPMLKLITVDGRTFGTSGRAVLERLASVVGHNGAGPWEPPVPVTIFNRKKRTGLGFYHDLRVRMEECE